VIFSEVFTSAQNYLITFGQVLRI